MKKILVIGSLNLDITSVVKKFPKLGETIFAKKFYENCGGKGFNQAITISKLGLKTEMIGMLGKDEAAKKLISSLKDNNVICDNILFSNENDTGKAIITVNENGDNNIIVIPGSNFDIKKKDIDKIENSINENDIVVLQNEIPKDTIEYVLEKATKLGKVTIYNPAPASSINNSIYKYIDYLILNETEFLEIFNLEITINNILKVKKDNNIKNIIVTLGKEGSISVDYNENVLKQKAYKVNSIDSTAAGDSFLGAFIYKIDEGVEKALKYASAVSAIVVTREGVSIPTKEEIIQFIKENEL